MNRAASSSSPKPRVHKFGGTSVKDASCIAHVVQLIRDEAPDAGQQIIVTSAMAGVTDAFIDVMRGAAARQEGTRKLFEDLCERHQQTAKTVLGDAAAAPLVQQIVADAEDLEKVLRATWLLQSASVAAQEFVAGHGELWNMRLLAAALNQAEAAEDAAAALDARDVLVVEAIDQKLTRKDAQPTDRPSPNVHWDKSKERLDAFLREHAQTRFVVVTGFLAASEDGVPTTLGRNGSDLSASIFGALSGAEQVTIWTDVLGVLTADPRKVSGAQVTPHLSYDEAVELAYFGAKVLHPGTMAPAMRQNVPIVIRNTFAPEHPGSRILPRDVVKSIEANDSRTDPKRAVRGLTTVDQVALINVEGTGMMGVPGVAQRVFAAMAAIDVNVLMISQASSEHSICFAIPHADADAAQQALEDTFAAEILSGRLQRVDARGPCAILAAVGDRMVETPGVSARFFRALAASNVNVMAIAQGSSERNLSVVVSAAQAEKALRAAHAAFTLSDLTLSIGLVGPGLIGATFLAQLRAQLETLKQERGIDARVRAVTSSKKMLLAEDAIDLARFKEAFEDAQAADLDTFTAHVATENAPHKIIIDCTASDAVADWTPRWLSAGIHVITPNKKATSGDPARAKAVADRPKGTHFFSEATVGAGLPVLSTLRDLRETGDDVIKIEGVLSGTLSFLFNGYDGTTPFSTIVRQAKEMGYTEPDPREDLSGLDVARKVVILARELGLDIRVEDLALESLVPAELEDENDVDAFLEKLAAHDDAMERRRKDAEASGKVLRYVGVIEPGNPTGEQAAVALRGYDKDHAFAGLSGSDNILAFTTARYCDQPLIIRGPGAGPEVTAAGIFSDLLRLCAHLEG